jgi:hypothetical protein
MAEPTGYPVAQSSGQTPWVQPAPFVVELTPEETAAADLLYDELKPMATATAREYVLARTPAAYQEYMVTKIEADWPAPPADDPAVLESRRRDLGSGLRRADIVPAVVRADPPVGSTYEPRAQATGPFA